MSEQLSREQLEIIACCVESECDGDCPHAESERCLLQGDRDLLTAMRALLAHISALEAEVERLRDVVDAALLMRSACPMDWTHGDCHDSQCAVVCCALAALEGEVGDRNDIDQICRDNSAAVEEMMAANRGGGGVSNPRVCPLLAAGILAGADNRAGEKIQAGWDRCQGIDCAWWDQERGECAVVPKWTTLTTGEATDE